ncbi:DUF5704 domain-containing protein [Anaerotalea alkaliphila]|uniref:DUF5704 domain-containing protein n=1 Tax=Anaerotalea alkaliphila TaxID=2662126 RepID=A0A7X5KL26_9FIRM|nr:DUF5704 domain-containing protein [Anaerotalea alkaliphila]NDL66391.1 hypothetical protein [Anaerotalea alkaliphila]
MTQEYGGGQSPGDFFDESEGPEPWLERAILLQPITEKSRGLLRFEHLWDSNKDGVPETWYITVVIPSKSEVDSLVEVTSTIQVEPRIPLETMSIDGTFHFAINSLEPLVSYEILEMENAMPQDPALHPLGTPIPITGNWYTGTVPLYHSTPTARTEIRIVLKATDQNGSTAVREAMAVVEKSAPAAPPSDPTLGAGDIKLRAMARGGEIFDVSQGIPTGEKLYAQVDGNLYGADYAWVTVTGTRTYTVVVTGRRKSTTTSIVDGEVVYTTKYTSFSKTYLVSRSYSYRDVVWYYAYGVDKAQVGSAVLAGGSLEIPALGGAVSAGLVQGGILSEPSDTTVNVGTISSTSGLQSVAEGAIGSILTEDDRLLLQGSTILPGNPLPDSPRLGPSVLYRESLEIPPGLANRGQAPTAGSLWYKLAYSYGSHGMAAARELALQGNPVTVHTPVVCRPVVLSRIADSTAAVPDPSLPNLLLGDSFEIRYPTQGSHRSIPGYGTRDYAKYTQARQVQFPFDVYQGGVYRKAWTWTDFSAGALSQTYFLPAWAAEAKEVTVRFRTLPTNGGNPETAAQEPYANLGVLNHQAVAAVKVSLTGQLYNFRVTYNRDPAWEAHYKGADTVFHSGRNNPWGIPDPARKNILPVTPGKNTGNPGAALRLGYPFCFDFLTNGDTMEGNDFALVRPRFHHVDAQGKNRQEVDAYYNSGGRLVKLGDPGDNSLLQMVLYAPGRGIIKKELEDTAAALAAQNRGDGKDMAAWLKDLANSQARSLKAGNTIRLTEQQRTFVGNFASLPPEVGTNRARASIQKWYGQYHLPSSTVFVPAGTRLGDLGTVRLDRPPFLQTGYIMVNFQVEVHKNVAADIQKDGPTKVDQALQASAPHLLYDNQWDREGYDTAQSSLETAAGDVVLYHVDRRASGNYQ